MGRPDMKKQTRWYFSCSWKLFGFLALVAFVFVLLTVQGFLAVTSPSGRGVLVVEAWVPQESLADSVRVFQSGKYQYLVLVGRGMWQADSAQRVGLAYADSAEAKLAVPDVHASKVVEIPVGPARNRTYAGAVAFRNWLRTSGAKIRSVDVFTQGVHARKSWILFEHALGDSYEIGVIAGPEHSYDPRLWLISPRGLWIVSRNVAGYLYFKAAIVLEDHGRKILAED